MHGLFQYPAMMVPQMQARILADIQAACPNIRTVCDPFAGSGTVMTEAMIRGLDFYGQDINPLAVLLCRVKAGPFFIGALGDRAREVSSRINSDTGRQIDIESKYPGWRKWFREDVALSLSRIARAIRKELRDWSRRFFWVALAETIRLVSNSRTSTFKLHIRPADEIRKRRIDPLVVFRQIVDSNLGHLKQMRDLLWKGGHLSNGWYKGQARVALADSSIRCAHARGAHYDLLVSSPPYGDNVSTVTYGQHAFLPLQWIDAGDIDPDLDLSLLANTHAIDSKSIGGSRAEAFKNKDDLSRRSESFSRVLKALEGEPRDRAIRVAAFCRDLDRGLKAILASLRCNAYLVWVVGNRRVANKPVPLQDILSELLTSHGATLVTTLDRKIPAKRMATRNSIASTMSSEYVVVMRKGGKR